MNRVAVAVPAAGCDDLDRRRRPAAEPTENNASVCLVGALAFVLALLIAGLGELGGPQRVLAPGAVLSVLATVGFLRQGGTVISASSAASYGLLVFGGFPAVYVGAGLYPLARTPPDGALLVAVGLCAVLQLLILAFSPCRRYPDAATRPRARVRRRGRLGWFAAGVGAFLFALAAPVLEWEVLAPHAGFAALLFAATGAFGYPGVRPGPISYLTLALLGIGYVELVFDGFGRLVPAVMAMAVLMLASLRLRLRWLKPAVLLGTAPALLYLALHRLEYLQALRGLAAPAHEGIGSVVSPLVSSAFIVEAIDRGLIAPALGATVLPALLVWVPRAVWPTKPPGFGLEMVPITQPHMAGVAGFSDAALVTGEIVWNVGPAFAVLPLALLALGIRGLDAWLLRTERPPDGAARRFERLLVVVLTVSSLHLLWGGLFTLTSRALPLIVGLGLLALAGAWLRAARPARPGAAVDRPATGRPVRAGR